MQKTQLTKIIQPTNSSVKSFKWERLYVATWSLDFDKIKFNKVEKVTYENKPSRANQETEIWDVIFAKMQWTKKTLLITEKEKVFIYSSWFFVLRPSEQILSWYLKHFLNSASFLEQKDKNCTWATQKALTLEWLNKIQIPLPNLSTQKQIIQKLDKLTEIINLRKLSIQKTEQLTKSIFIEMFGDISINSKWFKLMRFWEVLSINSKMVNPKNEPYSSMICIWWANIISENWNLINLKTAKEEGSISNKFLITENEILFSKIRPKLKKVAFPRIKCLCSADIYPLTPNLELVSHNYIIIYLLSDLFTTTVSWFAEKRAQIPKVNREELDSLLIPVPPLSLQNKFANIVQKNEENIAKQKQSLAKLQELYNTTMQESFSF